VWGGGGGGRPRAAAFLARLAYTLVCRLVRAHVEGTALATLVFLTLVLTQSSAATFLAPVFILAVLYTRRPHSTIRESQHLDANKINKRIHSGLCKRGFSKTGHASYVYTVAFIFVILLSTTI